MNLKSKICFAAFTIGAVLCHAQAPSGEAAPAGGQAAPAEAPSLSLLTPEIQSQLSRWPKSEWGYLLPVPVSKLPQDVKTAVQETLPMEAIGVVKTEQAPYRTTCFYLGKKNGQHQFGIAGHVAVDRVPYEVEFTKSNGEKFTVPVDSQAIAGTSHGDFAIVGSRSSVSPEVEGALSRIKPVTIAETSITDIMAKHPEAKFFVAGRGSFDYVMNETKEFPALWSEKTKSSLGKPAIEMWRDARLEARDNLDTRPDVANRQGDLMIFSPVEVFNQGKSKEILDPDGLKIKSKVATPYLPSGTKWIVDSVGGNYHGVGRFSGSPVFAVTSESAQVVGVHWTLGVPQNIKRPLAEMKKDGDRVFGEVVVEKVNGKEKLVLKRTAPFSFFSSMERANREIKQDGGYVNHLLPPVRKPPPPKPRYR